MCGSVRLPSATASISSAPHGMAARPGWNDPAPRSAGAPSSNGLLGWPPSSHSTRPTGPGAPLTMNAYDANVRSYDQRNVRTPRGTSPDNRTQTRGAGSDSSASAESVATSVTDSSD